MGMKAVPGSTYVLGTVKTTVHLREFHFDDGLQALIIFMTHIPFECLNWFRALPEMVERTICDRKLFVVDMKEQSQMKSRLVTYGDAQATLRRNVTWLSAECMYHNCLKGE